jgi:hypothetical protein
VDDWGFVVPGHSVAGRLSTRCRRVLAVAATLADGQAPRVVIFSGWARNGGASEAEQMLADWPGRRDIELVIEPTARITAENASRSLPLLLERGIRHATVVCSALHATRVRYLFPALYGRFGVDCDVRAAWTAPTPAGIAWELAAFPFLRRQRRAAFSELRSVLGG